MQKAKITCKFCQNERLPVRSHIIPEAFFRAIDTGPKPLRLLTNTSGEYPKRANIGVYDQFLCGECENRFAKLDNYGAKLLLGSRPQFDRIQYPIGSSAYLTCKHFDYPLLKLFFISLLWRASASEHSFYKRVNLGPFSAKAHRAIEIDDPGDRNHFSVLLSCWDENLSTAPLHMAIMDPFEERLQGIRVVRFYLGEFMVHIKVDQRHLPDPIAKFVLQPDQDLVAIARDPRTSSDLSAARDILNSVQIIF